MRDTHEIKCELWSKNNNYEVVLAIDIDKVQRIFIYNAHQNKNLKQPIGSF